MIYIARKYPFLFNYEILVFLIIFAKMEQLALVVSLAHDVIETVLNQNPGFSWHGKSPFCIYVIDEEGGGFLSNLLDLTEVCPLSVWPLLYLAWR